MEEIKRECPNGWLCEECLHEEVCAIGQYYIEPEITIIEIANKIEKEVVKEASKDARNIIRGTWASQFLSMTEDQRWEDYRKHHIGDLMYKEPYKAMAGAIVPGGGSKSNVKKSNKGCKPTVYIWGATI